MLRSILIICTSILLLASISRYEKEISEAKDLGKVTQVEGYFIYSYSKPIKETDYLGTVKIPAIFSDNGDERIKKLIKICKKEFPKAEALVISDDFAKADAISFKDEK